MVNIIPASTLNVDEVDYNPDPIFHAVGLAIHAWELMEEHFAILYSIFIGKPYTDEGVMEYGAKASSLQTRLARLQRVAETYFISSPSQDHEGELAKLKDQLDYLLLARHRIAHGRMRAVFTTPPEEIEQGQQFELVPWYFWSVSRHATSTLASDELDGAGSKELHRLRERFLSLATEIQTLCVKLHPRP